MSRQEFINSILYGRTDHFNFDGYCRVYFNFDMSRPITFQNIYNYNEFWFSNYRRGDKAIIITRPEKAITFCFAELEIEYKLLDAGVFRIQYYGTDFPNTIVITEPIDLEALAQDLFGLVNGSKGSRKGFKYAS